MIAEFTTIVGLLSAFTSGRNTQKQLELSDFLVWLEEHNHGEIKQSIETNQKVVDSIKEILNIGLTDIKEKLDGISKDLAVFASKSAGVKSLAIAYASETISDQAIGILKAMEESNSEYFLLSEELGSGPQRLILSRGSNYLCNETRFFQDDLHLMLKLGLLIAQSNAKRKPIYYYTRAASKIIKNL